MFEFFTLEFVRKLTFSISFTLIQNNTYIAGKQRLTVILLITVIFFNEKILKIIFLHFFRPITSENDFDVYCLQYTFEVNTFKEV